MRDKRRRVILRSYLRSGCITGTGDIVESDTAACMHLQGFLGFAYRASYALYILQRTARATRRETPEFIFIRISLFRIETVTMDTFMTFVRPSLTRSPLVKATAITMDISIQVDVYHVVQLEMANHSNTHVMRNSCCYLR